MFGKGLFGSAPPSSLSLFPPAPSGGLFGSVPSGPGLFGSIKPMVPIKKLPAPKK